MTKPAQPLPPTQPLPPGRALAVHLARGAVGIGAILLILPVTDRMPPAIGALAGIALLATAVWAFRGCPMCWTARMIGIVQSFRA